MIKKISIISLLTFSVLFSSFYVKQKKAEAVVPFALYVAAAALIHFAVGAYIYLQSQSGGNDEAQKISAINTETGEITIDFVESVENGPDGVPVYPASGVQTGCAYGQSKFNPNDPEPASSNARASAINAYADGTTWNGQPILYFTIALWNEWPTVSWWRVDTHTGNCNGEVIDTFDEYTYDPNGGAFGGVYDANIEGDNVEMYEFIEDVPLLPTCFDGIQNQDETGIDCGGVCEMNFGFVCPPVETCADDIMNQDETGIDYGGVCGTDDPVAAPAQNFTDTNQDGVDDLSGLDATGSFTVASPGDADGSTYDSSLPGDISEVGETDWTGLITGYLATNPLVLLATGSSISLSGEDCTLTTNVFGTDIVIDFCSVEGLVDLIGTFVLGLMTIRSVFIAMGI
jgi:hypothetical protein